MVQPVISQILAVLWLNPSSHRSFFDKAEIIISQILLQPDLNHHLIDSGAVFFVEGDKAPDGAFAPVTIAKCPDKPGDIFLFCAEFREVLRHAQGDQKPPECLNACFCGLFGMVKVHLAAPDADSSLGETHDIVLHDIAENSRHGDRKSGTVGAVTRKSTAETAELR